MSIKNAENKLTNIKIAKTLSQKYSVQKKYGQNFLISTKSLHHLVNSADLVDNDIVIEIGPGFGSVTEEIINHGLKPIAFEIDEKKIEFLQEYFGEQIELINESFLDVDLDKFLKEKNISRYKVISSLPYNVSKPIINKLLIAEIPPISISVIIQREVGQDYISLPPDASFLGVFARIWSDVKSFGRVESREFYPRPKVDGMILRFLLINKYDLTREQKQEFSKFVKLGFMNPRKQLQSVLKNSYPNAKEILIKEGFKDTVRAQELTVDDWHKIWRGIVVSQ